MRNWVAIKFISPSRYFTAIRLRQRSLALLGQLAKEVLPTLQVPRIPSIMSIYKREPVWPSGRVNHWLVSRGTSVRICFGSPFTSKAVVSGHCLVTLSFTIMKH